ncbi:MAG: Type 1 glutamine amidotransferase-like domain-containing protein [Clostridia bacterium]|nr:Type 1 glutamine amidotransferase-like domain-containing protein [Clostridia bacterium]
MICFLTSSPFLPDENALNPANGFAKALRASLPAAPVRAVFVASSPDEAEKNDYYAGLTRIGFEASGFSFSAFGVLDRRNADRASEVLADAGLVILAGGHVPTQNAFFADIDLKALLAGYTGVVIGISAGTMNAAETVYAQPELEGEALSPDYRRFLPGLGLTRAMVIPHFDGNLFAELDGLRIYGDVTFPDSHGRRFYLLPDGSYIRLQDGREELCGEAYAVEDGALRPLCKAGMSIRL